jgi:regulator of RNase E activity RraA
MLGHVEVKPGDIVFADETEIVNIPAPKKGLVLSKANEIRAAEEGRRAEII